MPSNSVHPTATFRPARGSKPTSGCPSTIARRAKPDLSVPRPLPSAILDGFSLAYYALSPDDQLH